MPHLDYIPSILSKQEFSVKTGIEGQYYLQNFYWCSYTLAYPILYYQGLFEKGHACDILEKWPKKEQKNVKKGQYI